MFKIAVLEYGVSYDRFREDFINSHTYHDDEDADSRNDHLVNLGRIGPSDQDTLYQLRVPPYSEGIEGHDGSGKRHSLVQAQPHCQ